MKKNDYGSLCTEMYELLHKEAPEDELAFYLSYARPGMSILEPLCGSGRFLVPFLRRGLSIQGMDNSREMLDRLLEKAPEAQAVLCDLEAYQPTERFDYIFIPSGSVSLFTDMETCKGILRKMKTLLKAGGRFVFAVDTTATRCPDSDVYTESVSVETAEKHRLVLKSKSRYDEATRTQFNPSLYELYDGGVLAAAGGDGFSNPFVRAGRNGRHAEGDRLHGGRGVYGLFQGNRRSRRIGNPDLRMHARASLTPRKILRTGRKA